MLVTVGVISGAVGIRGQVRVRSFTRPAEALLQYTPWLLRRGDITESVGPLNARPAADGFAVSLPGIEDRDAAAALKGTEILIERGQLPAPSPGEYYWADLLGLRVENRAGEYLGAVERLLETGANDVLVLQGGNRERLVPFVTGVYVDRVDLEAGLIVVDWHPDD